MRGFIRRYFLFFIFFIIMLAVVGYFSSNHASYKNPEYISATEAKTLVVKVGELILLPSDEVPTIATVSDPALLKDQPFFIGAKGGDKVLIYANAKKAILYDPVINKIINVAYLNTGDADRVLNSSSDIGGSVSSSDQIQF